ncbi:helix-turn-helix domain-containing protein [Fodinicola feengrottensis]|uniref:Helix-turn-helix domain-containing protein n=1 Tax=Fodinicola feengrottensis TaxID=435914 RepID=A0ABN2HPR6_9ACTN
MTADSGVTLPQRLKQLRAEFGITQKQLAGAMGISAPLISSWEKVGDPVLPPADRLESYAEIFASRRSADDRRWRPLRRADLTAEEETRRQELAQELLTLAAGTMPDFWQFPTDQVITIVCARLPENLRERMPYVDESDPDYVRLYNYADLDSLIELFGHIRATNPANEVQFKLAHELVVNDYTSHLVLLGGVDWNVVTREMLARLRLPVQQLSYDAPGGAAFEVPDRNGTRRISAMLDAEGKTLLEDVALFVRGESPLNRKRTVTICNGMYGHGTYGAVRALTDPRFRNRNGEYVAARFAKHDTYSLLFRVGIFDSTAVTPDWTAEGTVLHEWPEVE